MIGGPMKTDNEQVKVLTRRTVDLYSADELAERLKTAESENRPLRIKYGADPSAPDIHLGHVVGLNKLREFQDAGHTVVFIIGDFTGMIGDPSGRSKTRPPLTKEQVDENARSYQEQIFNILDRERTEIRFNSEWFSPMTFEDVIRLSSHVTVAQMLQRDDFSKRYGSNQPISLVEFLYPLVQAYDSVMINADVELGGTDQLFNLLLGRELQQVYGQPPQVVMTLPLIEGLDGVQKMSKSLNNYIGVTEDPKEIFGKVMSVSDDLMWRYYALILCSPEDELQALREQVQRGEKHPRDVKDTLGRKIIEKFHDEQTARAASEAFASVFSKNQLPDNIPDTVLGSDECENGCMPILQLLVRTGLINSKGEGRRLIDQGGVRVNDEKVAAFHQTINLSEPVILRVGKRKFARISIS